jgi:hypothetical protein
MVDVDNPLRGDRELIRGEVNQATMRVRRVARRYRRVNMALLLLALVCGALSTALAGDAARGGRISSGVAQATTGRVPSELPRGWRNVCTVIAVLTFTATVVTGANSGLKIVEHQARSFACVGALDALQTELLRESVLRPDALDKAHAEFAAIRRQYAEYLL